MSKCNYCYHNKVCIDGANYNNAKSCKHYVPAADVQEVVRCKDCKYFLKYKGSNECFCYKGDLLNIIKPDDYCSQSVRMGDNMNEI